MQRKRGNSLSLLAAPLLLSLALALPSHAATSCKIADLREQYTKATGALNAALNEKRQTQGEEIDLKDQGCISDYGLNGGFGLPSLASGFLNGLKDKACEAADNYLASNLDQLSVSLTSPMGVSDLDLDIGKRGDDDSLVTLENRTNELGVDLHSLIDDQFDRLPVLDNGFGEYNYEGPGDYTDYDYTTRETVSGDRR